MSGRERLEHRPIRAQRRIFWLVAERLRLADLLGGLSMVADLGFGLPPGTAVRTLSGRRRAGPPRSIWTTTTSVTAFYTALLMHVGCVAVAHESAAAFGDDIALNRAVARTNLADPDDIAATFVPELTRGMAAGRRRPGAGVRAVPRGVRVGASHRHRGVRGGP